MSVVPLYPHRSFHKTHLGVFLRILGYLVIYDSGLGVPLVSSALVVPPESITRANMFHLVNSVLIHVDRPRGGVPREHTMIKGHLPRVVYHQVYNVY